jgi:integrase
MKGHVTSYTTADGHKLWRVRYDLPLGADGQRRQRSESGFTRRKDAHQALRDRLGKVEQGMVTVASSVTLTVYLREWLAGISVKPNTLADYSRSAEAKVIPRLGGVKLQHLTAEHLDGLYRELERRGTRAGRCGVARGPKWEGTCREHDCSPERHGGLKPKSVRNVHIMLHAALRDAVERGHVLRNVADLAHPPTARQARSKVARERVWSPAQIRTFLAAAEPELLHPLFFLIATTGMRREEPCSLDLGDLDLATATVTVRSAKSEAGERMIALDAQTVAVLRRWLATRKQLRLASGPAWQESGRLFCDEQGQPCKPDRVYRRLVAVAAKAQLPAASPHTLRHSYATAALRAGVPVHVVSARLGHADPAVTLQIYSHVLAGDDSTAAQATATAILGG